MEDQNTKKEITDSKLAETGQNEIDTMYILTVLFRYKYFIAVTTFIIAVSSIVYVLIAQPMYEAQAKVYPVGKGQSTIREIEQTFGLANKIEGVNLLEVIRSKTISKIIISTKYQTSLYEDEVNLIEYWNIEESYPEPAFAMERAIKVLSKLFTSSEDKESGMITIKVRSPERQLSADIANNFAIAVTNFLQEEQKKVTVISRVYIENRLAKAEEKLLDVEEEMIKFKEQNYQLSSPALRAEIIRLERRFSLAQGFVSMLSKQRELILLEEARDRPVVNILDEADISFKPITPQKREIVITNTIMALLLSALIAFLKEKYYKKEHINKIIRIVTGRE